MIFADGTSEPTNTRPVSIGGMLLNPAGNVVSYFGSYIFGSLLDVFLEEQRHTIFELETFPVVVALRAWSKFIMGKFGILLFGQRCSEIDLHSCKCFDIPEYHSGCGLCRLEYKGIFSYRFAELPAAATQQINHSA